MNALEPKLDWYRIGREARAIYDDEHCLSRGDRAALRRCASAEEIMLEAAFWRIAAGVPPRGRTAVATAVVCYPTCESASDNAKLGFWLRRHLQADRNELRDGDAMKFRRLLTCTEPADLVHQLRRMLTQIAAPLDWGVFTRDLFYWSIGGASRDRVRRQWAQDFYTATDEENFALQEDPS